MGPRTSELVTILDETIAVLRSAQENHWSAWLEKDAAWIRADDFYGVEHFLSAFGGMGSLNDLVLCPANGHTLDASQIAPLNDRLNHLLSQSWSLARELERNVTTD